MGLNTNINVFRLMASLSFKYFALFTNFPPSKIMQKYDNKLEDCINHFKAMNVCSVSIANTETVKIILSTSKNPKFFTNLNTNKNIGIKIILSNKNQYPSQSVSQSLAHKTLPKYRFVVPYPTNLTTFHIKNDIGQSYLLKTLYLSKRFRLKIDVLQSFKSFNNYLIRTVITG